MNRHGSFEGGGSTSDVESERCRLAGRTSWGPWWSISNLNLQKSETRHKQETKGSKKSDGGKTGWLGRYL